MRLSNHLHQISPLLSSPQAARRALRFFSLVLVAGILGGAYSILLFTFNNEISQRRSYMSSAIAEAHTFFTTREALLESLSLSTTRKAKVDIPVSEEEIRLLLGPTPGQQWSIWLTQRMRDFLKAKRLNLLYISCGAQPQVLRLFNGTVMPRKSPRPILNQLQAFYHSDVENLKELWLTHANDEHSQLYIFIRLDERDPGSGWLGLEMDDREISSALSDHSAGEFTMFNAQGMPLFSNSQKPPPRQDLPLLRQQDFFGFVGTGWLPEQLVLRKQLKSSDWQLTYSIGLLAVLSALWPQCLGVLVFCLLSISLVYLLSRRLEHRVINPAIHRLQALVESEAFSRDVIQTAPVALRVLRRTDGQVVLENALARQWLGGCSEQLAPEWIRAAFDTNEPLLTDCFETSEGRHLYLSCAPTRYKGEDVLLCAFSDISARRQIEAALEQARQSADAANEAKTLFLATMSHEIRTPLYGVLGTLELLSRTQLDTQQKSYLQAIEGCSATLLQLICDVLDVSKIEAGQLALEVSEFSPVSVAQELVQGYAAAAQRKGLQLYACLDPQLPGAVTGDASRVRQILNNLLNNAVKFTDCGRIVLRVNVVNREGERLVLQWQVADTGKGIAQDEHKAIFEPFYQVKANKNPVAGTGLGLSICQRLTHLMNGSLEMVSKPGLGSSFSLTVPLQLPTATQPGRGPATLVADIVYVESPVRELAQSICGWLRRWGANPQLGYPIGEQLKPTAVLLELHPTQQHPCPERQWPGLRIVATGDGAHERPSQADEWQVNLNDLAAIEHAVRRAQGGHVATSALQTEPHSMQPLHLHILVAEDNVINQLILRDQLEELGCTVALASDGEEALALWHAGDFDIVLTDVNMPRLNGYELSKALRQAGCSTPIVGATANAMRGEDALCLAAGMNHCLIKPFTLRGLSAVLAPYGRMPHDSM
ncbi:ATP-binding protein [Pseudomonas juntendi]|uniref:ATP-binding protein n=1 Tax=Pseudomonas juntendi TaxID=2666183 RepID=UPI001F43085B|nr:ATP-binding protein [Pseudomonas juntendi]